MTNSVQSAADKSALASRYNDGLLALSVLSMLPLMLVFCSDLWFRSDFRFFPLLIIVPIGWGVWRVWRPETDTDDTDVKRTERTRRRDLIVLGLWTAGGISGVAASLLFSPWLAMLGFSLAWLAWLLNRFELRPWPRLLKWIAPLAVLLVLPLGERSNPVPNFSSNVTYASSSLLDLIGIDHLPSEQSLLVSVGRYDVAAACRGLGNPYLMFSLVVLLCIATRCSLVVGLITSAAAPLWSWGGSVLLVVGCVWLADQRGIFIWPDQADFFVWPAERLYLVQMIVVVGGLMSALLMKWGLQKLLAPFIADSAGIEPTHAFFNRVVIWPAKDPLLRRRPSERGRVSPIEATGKRPWVVRHSAYVLGVVAALFVLCGTLSILRLTGTASAGWPSAHELVTQTSFTRLAHQTPVTQATLPEELSGMRVIGFEQFATPGTTTGQPVTSRWTYINEKQTVTIQLDAAYRGALAIERQSVLDGSRLVERLPTVVRQTTAEPETAAPPEQSATEQEASGAAGQPAAGEMASQEQSAAADTRQVRIESLNMDDPIHGRSYLAYTNWPIDGSSPEALQTHGESFVRGLQSTISYRPSSACVSLWLEGSMSQTKQEQAQLQQMLARAAEILRQVE